MDVRGWRGAAVAALVMGVAGGLTGRASGNETDQYLLPAGTVFADIGPYLTAVHYRVLERAVERTNETIRRVRGIGDEGKRRARMERLHGPLEVANEVRGQFEPGFFETLTVERVLRSASARRAYGDRVAAYKRRDWIYSFAHLPFDPRNIPLLAPSSTVRAYGVYLGTDKVAHFHDLGHIYFTTYLLRLEETGDAAEAVRSVVWEYSRGPISEGFAIGFLATGVFSNADLASNYAGMKFYRNLTEPVQAGGATLPPLLVRCGDLWRLNDHVRPGTDFFAPFVSDHLNEALNPNLYEWGMRKAVSRRLKKEAEGIVRFYTNDDERPRDAGYFDDLARELSTYFGEAYGHKGEVGRNLVTVGDVVEGVEGVEGREGEGERGG